MELFGTALVHLRGKRRHVTQASGADLKDQAGVLGMVDEAARQLRAEQSVPPAQQGFCANDRTCAKINLGLILKSELVVRQRLLHFVRQANAVATLNFVLGPELARLAGWRGFRAPEGGSGPTE